MSCGSFPGDPTTRVQKRSTLPVPDKRFAANVINSCLFPWDRPAGVATEKCVVNIQRSPKVFSSTVFA